MDGVSGLEEGAKAIFPSVIVQRCIVHLVRNALRYIPSKDYKEVCRDMKKFYGASSLNAHIFAFGSFQNRWSHYSGAVDVWKRNFAHVEQLFDYGSAIRKLCTLPMRLKVSTRLQKSHKKERSLMRMHS